jgi:hypothetical protein
VRFSIHPAYIGIGNGLGDGWAYLARTWRSWLLVVVVVAVASGLLSTLAPTGTAFLYSRNEATGQIVLASNSSSQLGAFISVSILTFMLDLVAGWFFVGLAVSGLRNRPLDLGWMIERGLLSLAADILIAVLIAAVTIPAVLIAVATLPGGVLVILAWVVALVYVALALTFVSLAIFDGHGPIDGIQESWRLTRGAMLRVLGWSLMLSLVTLVFSVAGTLAAIPFRPADSGFVGPAVAALFTTTASVYTVFVTAYLYESQRARKDPRLYSFDPRQGVPGPFGAYYPPGYGPAPGYPPGPYGYPPYGQPPAGYPPYGQPPTGYPPYGYPPYGQPPTPPQPPEQEGPQSPPSA